MLSGFIKPQALNDTLSQRLPQPFFPHSVISICDLNSIQFDSLDSPLPCNSVSFRGQLTPGSSHRGRLLCTALEFEVCGRRAPLGDQELQLGFRRSVLGGD